MGVLRVGKCRSARLRAAAFEIRAALGGPKVTAFSGSRTRESNLGGLSRITDYLSCLAGVLSIRCRFLLGGEVLAAGAIEVEGVRFAPNFPLLVLRLYLPKN